MPKVLVVEDDTFLVSVYKTKLVKTGFDVQVATDGDEAMQILDTGFMPDVILLDLIMPHKDGFAFMAEVKERDNLKNIPILVASNMGQRKDIDKAMSLGASEYVVKSNLSIDDLVERIKATVKVGS